MEHCTRLHINFWQEIIEANANAEKLEEAGSQLTRSKELLREDFDLLLATNPNNIHSLVIYGKFLL